MQMTPIQADAVQKITEWVRACRGGRGDKPVFRVFGYAGTGKTSVVLKAVSDMRLNACYGAYTGKAAAVMRSHNIPAMTIHQMIYTTVWDKFHNRYITRVNPNGPAAWADLIVIDECSMVGPTMGEQLLRFHKPVLVIGDPAQLPPVVVGADENHATGYFTDAKPDVLLTEVHRQEADNPILQLATAVREGRRLSLGTYGDSKVMDAADLEDDELWAADQVLCGLNTTREALNARARKYYNFQEKLPMMGEKIVRMRNSYAEGMMNGEIFTVLDSSVSDTKYTVRLIDSSETVLPQLVYPKSEFFWFARLNPHMPRTRRFDFAYALSVHKAQGSQWNHVLIIDESRAFRENADKWLYTAITRAAKRVTIARGRVRW